MDQSCNAMAVALKNISHTLSPDALYIYGPFSERPEVFSTLKREFTSIMPMGEYEIPLIQLRGDGFSELATGCTVDCFQEKLQSLLLARF